MSKVQLDLLIANRLNSMPDLHTEDWVYDTARELKHKFAYLLKDEIDAYELFLWEYQRHQRMRGHKPVI